MGRLKCMAVLRVQSFASPATDTIIHRKKAVGTTVLLNPFAFQLLLLSLFLNRRKFNPIKYPVRPLRRGYARTDYSPFYVNVFAFE